MNNSNEKWLTLLKGEYKQQTLLELRSILCAALSGIDMTIEDKEDTVQSSLLKILENIDSFEGRSKFTTWAVAITVNTALSELRKRQWKDISLDATIETESIQERIQSNHKNPEIEAQINWSIDCVASIIRAELTKKQRIALLAELNGMPLQEIAKQMCVTRGAIYKLTFDARQKIIKCLKVRGLNPQDLLETE